MLIGAQRHLGLAVGGPHARTANIHPPAAERHLPILVAVSDRGPLTVPLPLRADDLVDLLLHHLG
jgi:hypothetical protein